MLAAEFGYSREHALKNINIPIFNAHMRYRKQSPPIGMLFKSFIGIEDEDPKESVISKAEFDKIKNDIPKKESSAEEMEAFAALFGSAGGRVNLNT